MANPSTNNVVISRTDSGFPDYLDFAVLRSSSIEYLSSLTGKVWTDYNVHDPGITILEMLIYALLDLGYRTNFPVEDIFARNPADIANDNNFFTPAQILTCNPLTITDFRKMLIDINGVKNAWLTVAEDITLKSLCNTANTPVGESVKNITSCSTYINGLYHITLQLHDTLAGAKEDVIKEVKEKLLSQRNLCEDFIDISVLCPLDIGICAEIGLKPDASAEDVYINIVQVLENFFSPAPQFYTLQQLLDKNKKIEDIFAGRPYDLKASHGFVDTDEFEKITLKTEIHLSDIYNVLMSIDGIATVKKLKLTQDGKIFSDKWQFIIPAGYTTVFSKAFSAVQFSINGIVVPIDYQKISTAVKAASDNSNKLIQPAANIDLAVPAGTYHNDLADYYSIQNEFPLNYGIGKGGLPLNATAQRQAQALQLKGYLLFFDQLLANYLSQLGNIRNLFSIKLNGDAANQRTYFLNELKNVPDFAKLILNVSDGNGANAAIKNNNALGYPVLKKDFEKLKQQAGFCSTDLRKIQQAFSCKTQNQFSMVAGLLQNNFGSSDLYQVSSSVATSDNLFFYYIDFPAEDIIVTGELYATTADALRAINLLPAMGEITDNYKSFSTGNGAVSFTIQLNQSTYAGYLSQIIEDKSSFQTRRDGFLNHLLSRFAEQFTDYALLSYSFLDEDDLSTGIIKSKEDFLTQYPLLSSSRGKAFDYRSSAKDNISGFEKRFKSYAGIESSSPNSLCNFEVVKYEETFSVKLNLAGFDLFTATGTYEGPANAQEAVQSIFSSLADPEKYGIEFLQHEAKYQLRVTFNNNTDAAYYPAFFNSKEEAAVVSNNLQKMFSESLSDNIIVSKYEYRLELKDSEGKTIRLSATPFDTEAAAFDSAINYLRSPDDISKWQVNSPASKPSGKFCSNDKKKPEKLVDIDAFKIDINNNIVGKPDKFNYELLDKSNSFHFRVLNEFTTKKQAYADAYSLLMLMTERGNYHLSTDKKKKLFILRNGQPVAECFNKIDNGKGEEFINKVCGILNNHYYRLYATPFACRWKFNYQLGFEKNNDLLFVSEDEFDKLENAENSLKQLNAYLQNINLEIANAKYSLHNADNTTASLTCVHVGSSIETLNENDKLQTAKQLLNLRKQINIHKQSATPVTFDKSIAIDDLSRTGAYVYRLTDKDNVHAQHIIAGGEDADQVLNKLYTSELTGYNVLNICLGGDTTESYKDVKTKSLLYRYVIRCHHDFGPFKKENILFESITEYASIQEAEDAFNINYLLILNKAMVTDNYGLDKYISLDEPKASSNSNKKNTAVVFIPKNIQVLAGANEAGIIKTLSETAKSYPVRALIKCSDEYKKLYPAQGACCLAVSNTDCKTTADVYVYYFALYNTQAASDNWQSSVFYNTPQDARQAYYFFMILLQYKGNYFIDKDYNNETAVFIREVLAESKSRFITEQETWGAAGIEKFICIAQTEDSFQSILNKKDCSYTFKVDCNTSNGIHPCKYESATKRDEVLEKLYTSFKNFDSSNLFNIVNEAGTEFLYGIDGKKLAIINSDSANGRAGCERILEILQRSGNDENYIVTGNKYTLANNGMVLASPYDDTMLQPAWKKLLLTLAFYYPVQLINEKYCIEIRLPGFNSPDNNEIKKPYGCGSIPVKNTDDCFVAWQGACCFDICTEAFNHYETIIGVLGNYTNYRAYFDCVCYSYGIALQTDNDIAAFNPQNYTSTEMACDAVERSKKLINREGIYLTEHILLRPRIQNDCTCAYIRPGNFTKETNCSGLFWKEEFFLKGNEEEKEVCFAPGEDPFSFIATVVLPSWPERFRKKENRDLLEMMLYRETPAHILLRILWLNPQDTCKFETPYKTWKSALLNKEIIDIDTASCNLMDFLFSTTLNCLSDCTDCLPCTDKVVVVACLDEPAGNTKAITANTKLNAINDLFGWNEMYCNNQTTVRGNTIETIPVAITYVPAEVIISSPREITDPIVTTTTVTAAIPDIELTQDEARFINSRLTVYKQNISRVYSESHGNLLAKDAGNVLTGTGNNPLGGTKNLIAQKNPAEEINRLLSELLSDDKTENQMQVLSELQKELLIKNLVCFYIDKLVFEEKNIAAINLIEDGLTKLRENDFDMQNLFTDWKPEEIARYEPTAIIDEIKAALLKNKS
jgi:uncharacterized protein YegP (UPF0339 family)